MEAENIIVPEAAAAEPAVNPDGENDNENVAHDVIDGDEINDRPNIAESTTISDEASTSSVQDDNNRLPMITLLRTFILSFFASLIPETPAV